MILIVGGSGFVGFHLFHYFKSKGYDVHGTYLHRKRKHLHYFDVNSMDLKDLDLDFKKIKIVIIASTAFHQSVDDSKKNWEKAHHINVVRICKLMDECFENDILPLYLSSDYVFYGKKGNYKETDRRSPLTFYGKIKYEVENHILKYRKPFIILRMGKIFGWQDRGEGKHKTFFQEMLMALKKGETLYCVDDQWITPLYVKDLCQWMELLIKHKHYGVFHLASLPRTTRFHIAKGIQKYFNLKNAHVIRRTTKDFHFLDKRPIRTDLNDSKFRNRYGITQKKLSHYLALFNCQE